MSMSSKEISLRMKFRKMSNEGLQAVLANDEASELEKKLAQEFLDKNGAAPVEKKEDTAINDKEVEEAAKDIFKETAKKKPAPKKATKKEPVEETLPQNPEPEASAEQPAPKEHPALTDKEEELLSQAEKEFAERQANRKTPSKTDRAMKEQVIREKAQSESKRENLTESAEVLGLKVGTEVTIGGETDKVGVITRVYRSGDGKEKCMVKFGDEKPIKKRVTAVTIVQK